MASLTDVVPTNGPANVTRIPDIAVADPFVLVLDSPDDVLPTRTCVDLLNEYVDFVDTSDAQTRQTKQAQEKEQERRRRLLPEGIRADLMNHLEKGLSKYLNRLVERGLGPAWTFQGPIVTTELYVSNFRRIRALNRPDESTAETKSETTKSDTKLEGQFNSLDDPTRVLRYVWFVSRPSNPNVDNNNNNNNGNNKGGGGGGGGGLVVYDSRGQRTVISPRSSGALAIFPSTWTYTFDYVSPSLSRGDTNGRNDSGKGSRGGNGSCRGFLVYEGGMRVDQTPSPDRTVRKGVSQMILQSPVNYGVY